MAARLAKDRIATGGSMNDEASFKRRPKTTWDILQLTLVVATPPFFVLGVNIFYVLFVFNAFKWYEHIGWKVFVTIFSQAVKVIGNKFVLKFMKKVSGNLDFW